MVDRGASPKRTLAQAPTRSDFGRVRCCASVTGERVRRTCRGRGFPFGAADASSSVPRCFRIPVERLGPVPPTTAVGELNCYHSWARRAT
jgi:hypothetical protein